MTDLIDPKLMQATDEAFWAELRAKRDEVWEEGATKRYVVRDGSTAIKVIVTDANLVNEKKIKV